MKYPSALLAAIFAGASSAFGGGIESLLAAARAGRSVPGPTRGRRTRPSKARQKKVGYGLRAPHACRKTILPWTPNVKGMRYTKAGLVPR